MESRTISLSLVSFLLVLVAPACAETDDEYWRRMGEEAHGRALAAYNPRPMSEINSFNGAIYKVLRSERRSLYEKNKAKCRATNPIDRCWRCQASWAEKRRKLANCAKGFGRKARGGRRGKIYVVTDPSDNEMENPVPGTLRHAVIQNRPLWIIFERDMVIQLREELIMTANKTIDGRGVNVRIAYGAGITIQYITNVIIHGLHIHNIVPCNGGVIRDSTIHKGKRQQSDGDAINLFGSSRLWIDHNTFYSGEDGLVDAVSGSTAITISNNQFTNHDHVMLLGANDEHTIDAIMQVTIAFNRFGPAVTQRMPRIRFGFAHVVNNDYVRWMKYAVGGTAHPTIISQGNRYLAPHDPFFKKITHREDYTHPAEWKTWNWTSTNDKYENGAIFISSGATNVREITKDFSRFDVMKVKPGEHAVRLARYAGALACRVGIPC